MQYAGAVEHRGLAPHAHFAVRGTIPRALIRQVAAATYHQVWWPIADRPAYGPGHLPVWDEHRRGWVDPDTGAPLPTWGQALDELDDNPDAFRLSRFLHAERLRRGTARTAPAGRPLWTSPIRPSREHDTTCLRTQPGLLDTLAAVRDDLRTLRLSRRRS